MCDVDPEEFAEYLLQREAALARARLPPLRGARGGDLLLAPAAEPVTA